jgi:hypothetical protein
MNKKNIQDIYISRRSFVRSSAILSAGTLVGLKANASGTDLNPAAKILSTRIVSWDPKYHVGWSTLIRRKNGKLLLGFNGGRDGHICPFGRLELMISHDEGKSWAYPRVVFDSVLDDRDFGLMETPAGTLLATTFSHSVYESTIKAMEQGRRVPFMSEGEKRPDLLVPERLEAWKAARDWASPEERKSQTGEWMLRSTDGGLSWSAPYRCILTSSHGPITLKNGRLLFVGKVIRSETGQEPGKTGVCESFDDGLTWKWIAEIPAREGDKFTNYHELHACEASNGNLIAHIRNHNEKNVRELLQSESTDGGKSWSVPHPIGVKGFPPHLLKLKDGRLLSTYGCRYAPLGIEARISADNGKTWSEAIKLSTDDITSDLGYPSTVELPDGSLLTVWYEAMQRQNTWFDITKGDNNTVLRQAHWQLNG